MAHVGRLRLDAGAAGHLLRPAIRSRCSIGSPTVARSWRPWPSGYAPRSCCRRLSLCSTIAGRFSPLARSRSKSRRFWSLLSISFAGSLIGRLYSALRTPLHTCCSASACYWRYGVGSGSRIVSNRPPLNYTLDDGWCYCVADSVRRDTHPGYKGRQQLLVGARQSPVVCSSFRAPANVVLLAADALRAQNMCVIRLSSEDDAFPRSLRQREQRLYSNAS